MPTNFIDDDLLKTDDSIDEDIEKQNGVPVQPITHAGLSRMVRQKKELSDQVAGAVNEIERLRMKQENLEKEKIDLKELTRRQEKYERGKQGIIGELNQGIIIVEREESQATRMTELLSETGARFKKELAELKKIKEETWSNKNFETELNKALVKVDIARTTYKKAMAKIDASSWHKSSPGETQSHVLEQLSHVSGEKRGFGFWLKVGLAVSLPIMLFLLMLFVAWLVVSGIWPA